MNKANKDKTYKLYHSDYGIVEFTKDELFSIEPKLKNDFYHFVKGKPNRLHGWILADRLEELGESYTLRNRNVPRKFYCPEEGIVECTLKEFHERIGGSYTTISALVEGHFKVLYDKWVLAENKDKYEELLYITELTHPNYGTHKLSRKQFKERFGLDTQSITDLVKGTCKTRKGWSLVG